MERKSLVIILLIFALSRIVGLSVDLYDYHKRKPMREAIKKIMIDREKRKRVFVVGDTCKKIDGVYNWGALLVPPSDGDEVLMLEAAYR